MLYLWPATSTAYYLINFYLKYMPGNIFLNSSFAAIAEILSYILAGALYVKFGLKKAQFFTFMLGMAGSIFIMLLANLKSIMPAFVLVAKFGIGAAFGLIYIANFIFPV